MLGRAYTARSTANLSAADDLIQITAPSSMIVAVDRVEVTQQDLTAVEQLQVILQRASSAGTGGSVTPEENEPGGPAASSTVLANTTTNATLSGVPLVSTHWNVLMPYIWHPKEGKEIIIPPSGIWVVRLNVAPSAATDVEVVVEFREIG